MLAIVDQGQKFIQYRTGILKLTLNKLKWKLQWNRFVVYFALCYLSANLWQTDQTNKKNLVSAFCKFSKKLTHFVRQLVRPLKVQVPAFTCIRIYVQMSLYVESNAKGVNKKPSITTWLIDWAQCLCHHWSMQ